jgi:Mg2+/Co2+ transporter CorB
VSIRINNYVIEVIQTADNTIKTLRIRSIDGEVEGSEG